MFSPLTGGMSKNYCIQKQQEEYLSNRVIPYPGWIILFLEYYDNKSVNYFYG